MKPLISLSFDDGRIDNYTIVRPLLKRYNLPATFNITTAFVNGEAEKGWLAPHAPMNAEQVRALFSEPLFEIAGHGYWHENTQTDIVDGLDGLLRLLDAPMLTPSGNGFASPGTGLTPEAWRAMQPALQQAHVRYARLSLCYRSHARLKTLARKAARLLHLPRLYAYAYGDTLMGEPEGGIVRSVPVLSSIRVGELMALVSKAVREEKACVLMFHSIVPREEMKDNWDYELSQFEDFCRRLADLQTQGLLRVATTMDVVNALAQVKGEK